MAAGVAYGIYRDRLGMDVAPGMPVLLLDTRDERPGRVSSVVDQLLRTQLNQSAHFEVLARDRVALALERMRVPPEKLSGGGRIAREVALREGSSLVISSFIRRSPHLRLEVQIEKLGSHPYFAMGTWSRSFPAESEPELRSAVSEGARWIRQSVGEHADDLARRDRRPEEATTSWWEALLAYVEAERARSRGDDAEAIRRLRDALAIDEAFPLAHTRLAEFLIGLGRNDEGYSHWMRAARLVGDRRLSDRESFRIRALFLHDMWAYAEAAKIFADWAADFPNDYLPYFYLANCQKQMGRPDDALDSLNTAFKKAPGNPHVVLNRAQLHLEQGRPHLAKADLDSIREANLWWWQYMAEYHFVAGEYTAAWNCFNRLANSAPEWRSKSFSLKACLLFECGQDQNAMNLLRAGISYDRSHERLASNLPGKYLLLASGALRNRSFKIAADEARNAVRAGGEAMTLLRAAALLCETGDRSAAPEFAARAARALRLSHIPGAPSSLRSCFGRSTVARHCVTPRCAEALSRGKSAESVGARIGAAWILRRGSRDVARYDALPGSLLAGALPARSCGLPGCCYPCRATRSPAHARRIRTKALYVRLLAAWSFSSGPRAVWNVGSCCAHVLE